MSFGQGGPQWGPGGSGPQPPQWGHGQSGPQPPQWSPGPRTPDWEALAAATEARARRRKWLMIGGAALATIAVGAVVAVAVVSANGDSTANKSPGQLPSTADIPSDASSPVPSFEKTTPPPPPDPKEYVSSAEKDKAPLSADTLFPDERVTMDGRTYEKGPTASTTKCGTVGHGDVRDALVNHHCTRVIRATYAKGGVAVTVGVALFADDTRAAKTVQDTNSGNIVSLYGSGVPAFCTTAICRTTANSYGRYTYFTTAGFTNGKDVKEGDRAVFAAGDDLAEYTFRRILHRGRTQASAAAEGR